MKNRKIQVARFKTFFLIQKCLYYSICTSDEHLYTTKKNIKVKANRVFRAFSIVSTRIRELNDV